MSDETAIETELKPARGAELIESGAELIDVRLPYEFEGGHLPGALNVEMNDLSAAAGSIARDRPVVFCCRTGNRSGMAAQAFREAGYEAYNLAGGIVGWVAAGRPIEPADGEVVQPLPPS